MKKIAGLLFVSILGGVITLGAYKFFLEEPQTVVETIQPQQSTYIPTNFVNTPTTTSSVKAVEAGIDFTTAAEKTVNAVVHVKNKITTTAPTTIWELYNGTGRQRTQIGTGSGVIISPDGYIVTNNHVIAGSNEIQVTMNDNKNYIAKLVATDPQTDIALLKVETDDALPYISFGDSDAASIGEWVLAVGNPFNLTSTVTAGIISAKARDLDENDRINQSFIQTDAAVNPGNSGGALVNTNGELIGINTAITSQTGSFIGYSFAVPSNIVQKIINDFLEFGGVQNGQLGVQGRALNTMKLENLEKLQTTETEGFYVSDVVENSGADKAGLLSGDIITKVDQIKINKFSDLSGYLKSKRPGDVVHVTISRDDDVRTVPVTLSKEIKITSVRMMNMELVDISEDDKSRYEIKSGLKVTTNNNRQLHKELGITPGYILVEVNGKKVDSASNLKAYLDQKGENSVRVLAFINPKGEYERFIFR